MMQLFRVWNTSSEWWVIAPDKEVAVDYSYQYTSTREKRNLGVGEHEKFYCDNSSEHNLKELLESNRVGIAIRREDMETFQGYWRFTISHKWIFEKHDWFRPGAF